MGSLGTARCWTPAQVAALCYRQGWRGQDLLYAVRIVLGESGGCPGATNRNSDKRRTLDRGLWQFNDYWHREVSDADAFDPYRSTAHAWRVWRAQGRSFSPSWGTRFHPEKDAQARAAIGKIAGAILPPPSSGAPMLGALLFGVAAFGLVRVGYAIVERRSNRKRNRLGQGGKA